MACSRWRVTPVASLMAAEITLPPTFSSTPSCSGAILPQVRYAAGSKSSAHVPPCHRATSVCEDFLLNKHQ